jgi:hypothetical protein
MNRGKRLSPCQNWASQIEHRRGVAVVELAVCLPVILLIGLGAIQAASMVFLRQAMVQSAYEAAKVAVQPNATIGMATAAATRVAAGRRINSVNVVFSPADITSVPKGQPIRVIVSAPGDSNSLLPIGVFKNQRVLASAVMVRE